MLYLRAAGELVWKYRLSLFCLN